MLARRRPWVGPGDHVIVTGGSSGIGLASAAALGRRGAAVSLVARGPERLAAAAELLRAQGVEARAAAADVTDRAGISRAISSLVERGGPCAVLVACAGRARPGHFSELPDEVFHAMMDVNYFGALWPVRAVVPDMMERRRGVVITIASAAGLAGVFGYTAYAPAKFAVRGLAETLRAELRPYGVHVACVFPPDVDTPALAEENRWKPAETAMISGAVRPMTPTAVAAGILRGVDRGQPVICVDGATWLLARCAGALAPLPRRFIDRKVRQAQRRKPADDPAS